MLSHYTPFWLHPATFQKVNPSLSFLPLTSDSNTLPINSSPFKHSICPSHFITFQSTLSLVYSLNWTVRLTFSFLRFPTLITSCIQCNNFSSIKSGLCLSTIFKLLVTAHTSPLVLPHIHTRLSPYAPYIKSSEYLIYFQFHVLVWPSILSEKASQVPQGTNQRKDL